MRRVVIGILTLLFLGCVTLVTVGYLYGMPLLENLLEEAEEDIALVMTDALHQTASEAINENPLQSGQIRIRDLDLSVNNAAVAGEAGWETGTSGTMVYGFDLTVSSGRLVLGMGSQALHSGVPVITSNRFELTGIQTHDEEMFGAIVSAERFEDVIETGLNRALMTHDLRPTDVSLGDGEIVITVTSVHIASQLPNSGDRHRKT